MSKQNRPANRGSFDSEDESAWRDLFQSAGYEPAPSDLSTRVIARLGAEKKGAFAPVRPLIPTAVWAALALLTISTILYSFSLPVRPGGLQLREWLDQLPMPSFQIALPNVLSVFEHVPKSLVIVIPFILIQVILIKYFYEGRFTR